MTDLDLTALALRVGRAAQGWAPGCEVGPLEPMSGGTVGLVYSAPVRGGPPEHARIVVKVAPPGLAPVRNRDVLRQARVIGALADQPGVAVPPLLFTDTGAPPEVPPLFATGLVAGECVEPLLEAARARLPDDLARGRAFAAVGVLAALHRVDPGAVGLGDEPLTTLADEVGRWTRAFETVPDAVGTDFRACAAALEATAPEAVPPAIVHGDLRLGNMLVEGTEVRAIVDWEIWTRSDPRIDLAWLLFFTDEARHPVVAADVDSGMPSDAEMLAAYEAETGGPVADLGWFVALTRYKEAAAMALIAKHAARRGDDDLVTRTAGVVPGLVEDARRRLG